MQIINKHMIILLLFLFSILYSLPNLYGEDPALIINSKSNKNINLLDNIKKKLDFYNIECKSIYTNNDKVIIRFKSTNIQFECFNLFKNEQNNEISYFLNMLPSNKLYYLNKIGSYPMKLGLDLRGGIHITLKVNIKNKIKNELKGKIKNLEYILKNKNIKYKDIRELNNKNFEVIFEHVKDIENTIDILKNKFKEINFIKNKNFIKITLKRVKKLEIRNNIINQTILILSNRINELGISDSIVKRVGKDRIAIEIPGIQDLDRAKRILGKTATLSFMLIDTKHSINRAIRGKIPKNSKIYYDKNNNPFLIKKKSVLDGDSIVYASSGFDEQFNKPCINIKINTDKIKNFEKITRKNIGKPMAIIYKENYIINKKVDNKIINKEEKIRKIINIATIMSSLSSNFQITGLSIQESKDTAIILRSGNLPATVSIIEEKIVGPTLGEKNVKNGMYSILVSLLLIIIFMFYYYKKLGLIANIILIFNLLLLTSLMSIIGIVLTLPGLAGIVLTIGISIDSNILIFERIKEEKKDTLITEYIISKSFKNAHNSIIDANCTTLLIGIILFLLGSGPIKGFAFTLSIGIITSMYCSLFLIKNVIELALIKNIKILK